jgi:hypothetical protein
MVPLGAIEDLESCRGNLQDDSTASLLIEVEHGFQAENVAE